MTVVDERIQRGEETKQRLLVAAREVIVEAGFRAASNRAVADRAGVNLALIKYHFVNKAGLQKAVLEWSVAELEAAAAEKPGSESLLGFVTEAIALVPMLDEDPATQLVATALQEARHDEALASVVATELGRFREYLCALALADGLEPQAAKGLAHLLAAMLDGLILHSTIGPGADRSALLTGVGHMLGRGE